MAGSGKHPGKEALKNKAMLVVRNVTKQEVTNVIFPNGLTVGTIDLRNGAKVHGNMQVGGVLNARDLRINGNPITGSSGDGARFLFMTLTSPFFSFPDASSTVANPESITIAVLQASQSSTLPGTGIQISGSDGTNLTGSLSGDFLDEFSTGNAYRSVNLTYSDSLMRNNFPLTASVFHEGIRQTRHIHKFVPSSTPSIYFSPSNVTFPADYAGNIDTADLSLGDTAISVLAGPGFLPVDNSSPFSDNTFRVGTPTATGITLGSEVQTDGTDTVTYTTHTSMTGDTATITYPVTVNINGSETTIDIDQDFIKAKSPAPTPIANLSNTLISIEADYLGRDPSDGRNWTNSELVTRFDLATTGSVTAGTTDIVWDGSTVPSVPASPDEGKFRLHAGAITGLTDQGTFIQYAGAGDYSGEGDKDARFYYGTASGVYHVALDIKNSDTSDTNSDPTIKLHQLGEWDDPTSAWTGGSTRFTNILLNIPFLVTLGGQTVTLNRQMIISKNKQPVPNAIAHLTNDVINIPTDNLGRNPDDNQYFSQATDFPDYAKSVLTVSAGSDDLTWYGDQNSSSPSNPPEGEFLIDWRSVTGTTENGTVLTYKSAGSFDALGQDKDYFIYIGNSSSGYVTWLRITEDSSGNPDIDMSKLTEFDDNGLNSYTDGSQRFDVIALTIPIKVTVAGTTETIEKNLTIVKNKQPAVTKVVSLRASSNQISYDSSGLNPSPSSITLTATSQNFTDGYFKFTGGGSDFADEASFSNGSAANSDTATFTAPTSYSATPYTFTVEVQDGSSGSPEASDTVTISSIKPGAAGTSPITVTITPENVVVPSDAAGTVTDFSNTGGRIAVSQGSTQYTVHKSGAPNNNTFQVLNDADVFDVNVTAPLVGSTGLLQFFGDTTIEIVEITAMSSTASSGYIDWTVSVKDGDGTTTEHTVRQTFTKNFSGVRSTQRMMGHATSPSGKVSPSHNKYFGQVNFTPTYSQAVNSGVNTLGTGIIGSVDFMYIPRILPLDRADQVEGQSTFAVGFERETPGSTDIKSQQPVDHSHGTSGDIFTPVGYLQAICFYGNNYYYDSNGDGSNDVTVKEDDILMPGATAYDNVLMIPNFFGASSGTLRSVSGTINLYILDAALTENFEFWIFKTNASVINSGTSASNFKKIGKISVRASGAASSDDTISDGTTYAISTGVVLDVLETDNFFNESMSQGDGIGLGLYVKDSGKEHNNIHWDWDLTCHFVS